MEFKVKKTKHRNCLCRFSAYVYCRAKIKNELTELQPVLNHKIEVGGDLL